MSFDLYFCRRSGEPLTDHEISQFCDRVGCFRREEDLEHPSWVYENEATGVYFSFLRQSAVFDEDDGSPRSIVPTEYVDARLSFNLNYIRPSFFGVEAMQVVASFCEAMDLFVLDPQSVQSIGDLLAERLDAETLRQRWHKNNLKATSHLVKQSLANVNHWSHARATYWFLYQSTRERDEKELISQGRDIFVPSLMLVVQKAEPTKIKTMIVWPEAIPFVFPPCDLVAVIRKRKAFLRGELEERGILAAEYVRAQLQPLLSPFDSHVGQIDHLPENQSAVAKRTVAGWKLSDGFNSIQRVSPDSFVDNLP